MNSSVAESVHEGPLERKPIFWFYGSASVAYGIKDNAFSYLLLIFANQVLGIPGYLASLALAIAMVWDAVSDLLLGHWSDKTSSRLGRRGTARTWAVRPALARSPACRPPKPGGRRRTAGRCTRCLHPRGRL